LAVQQRIPEKQRRCQEKEKPRGQAACGDALARIGDPRFRADVWFLPDDRVCGFDSDLLGFVKIPAGPFMMGSDKHRNPAARQIETPQYTVDIRYDYFIARWPVTVPQFQVFVDDKRRNGVFHLGDLNCLMDPPNHPARFVSWEEALMYCEWLNGRLFNRRASLPVVLRQLLESGYRVTLPSEAEWEKAARGIDGRISPCGNTLDENQANFWASNDLAIKNSSTVGCYPGCCSPYSVEELSGNVLEWTRSKWREYPYVAHDDTLISYPPNFDTDDPKPQLFRAQRTRSCNDW
jgi:formylglycine-generating enzyme required for sulfatase activity